MRARIKETEGLIDIVYTDSETEEDCTLKVLQDIGAIVGNDSDGIPVVSLPVVLLFEFMVLSSFSLN